MKRIPGNSENVQTNERFAVIRYAQPCATIEWVHRGVYILFTAVNSSENSRRVRFIGISL